MAKERKQKTKTNEAAEAMGGKSTGKVTVVKARKGPAPRVLAASRGSGSIPSQAAATNRANTGAL